MLLCILSYLVGLGNKDINTIRQYQVDMTLEPNEKKQAIKSNNLGFLIHGHNQELKLEVARFLENDLKRKVIILHEQPSKGKTIIEKFESYSDVDFAVALWTADDIGNKKINDGLNKRARQNVVFETGFFIGKIGRENVIILYEDGVEFPSDYSGVIFIPLIGNWKDELRKEIDSIFSN
jgi:predicted nucleotide-binding protein